MCISHKYNDVPSSPILVILMMEALSCSETSVLRRATRPNVPEDAFLRKNYKFAYTNDTIMWRVDPQLGNDSKIN
jgi:hypothetical protein